MVLLTISIPAHNKSFLLDEAISSIIKEKEFANDINLTISDNSLNSDIKKLYLSKYSKNKAIKLFDSKEFKCLDSNVNRSVEIASGKYVWIFGDDDIIVPGILSELIPFLISVIK